MDKKKLEIGAGTAAVEFSPEMLPTEGFCGIHDLPAVRILLMRGGESAVIASVELVMLDDHCMERCGELICRITGTARENIWIHVTHAISTPHTPGPMGPPHKRPEPGPEDLRKRELYYSAVFAAFERAARAAAESIRPAKMLVGESLCTVNRNRDVETPFGWWIGLGSGPSDHRLRVLRFVGEDGGNAAVLVSYALKPCVLDNSMMREGKREISSDVCGEACRILEEKLKVPVLFCMGAAGDQVPREMALTEWVDADGTVSMLDLGTEKGFEAVKRLGEELAQSAVAAAEAARPAAGELSVETAGAHFKWPGKTGRPVGPSRKGEFIARGEKTVDVGLIRLGSTVFVSAKPEINCETARQLFAASKAENTILISMVNGGMKYMPELSAYERCTWEAQSAMLMPGAAEKFVETALELINDKQKGR